MRTDDPVYYKSAINKLIKQAKENGLDVGCTLIGILGYERIQISFKADNGEIACATVFEGEGEE